MEAKTNLLCTQKHHVREHNSIIIYSRKIQQYIVWITHPFRRINHPYIFAYFDAKSKWWVSFSIDSRAGLSFQEIPAPAFFPSLGQNTIFGHGHELSLKSLFAVQWCPIAAWIYFSFYVRYSGITSVVLYRLYNLCLSFFL